MSESPGNTLFNRGTAIVFSTGAVLLAFAPQCTINPIYLHLLFSAVWIVVTQMNVYMVTLLKTQRGRERERERDTPLELILMSVTACGNLHFDVCMASLPVTTWLRKFLPLILSCCAEITCRWFPTGQGLSYEDSTKC